jgi:hypothetical protein
MIPNWWERARWSLLSQNPARRIGGVFGRGKLWFEVPLDEISHIENKAQRNRIDTMLDAYYT